MNADEARKLIEQHEDRKKVIKELINKTNNAIKDACEIGERHCHLFEHYYYQRGRATRIQEVGEHFKEQGFEIITYFDGSGHYLKW